MSKPQELKEWYWDIGHQRFGDERLSTSLWLDRLYTVEEESRRINLATARRRGALALWGASQSGKSTLLSSYIDASASADGAGSALDWGRAALFSDARAKVDRQKVIVFNPYNAKTDGSACITRFVLASQATGEVDPKQPVEVRLFEPRQLLHALAAGFLSECQPEDEHGQVTHWDASSLRSLLGGKGGPALPVPNRPAYELLRDVVDVLDLLCYTRAERYRNLLTSMAELRQAILETPRLITNKEAVVQFAARLFWNSWPAMTEVFLDLCALREKIARRAAQAGPDGEITCTMQAARVLVDFTSYGALLENHKAAPTIRGLRWKFEAKGVRITDDPAEGGEALFETDREFALVQALVWELVVPLRKEALELHSPLLVNLLERADILDIPGTGKEHEAAVSALLTRESIAMTGAQAPDMFRQILKRGKTSSLVLSSARNFDIDGFTIMAKWGEFVGNQKQLAAGVEAWWHSLLGSSMGEAKGKQLGLNFVVTFFGMLVTEMLAGLDADKVGQAFQTFFAKVGPLRDPRIASTFATTYNHIRDGKIEGAVPGAKVPNSELEPIYQSLAGRPDFNRQFIEGNWTATGEVSNQTLRQAIFSSDGGTDYLLRKLAHDAQSPMRLQKIQEKRVKLQADWATALEKVTIPADEDAHLLKKKTIEDWKERLQARLAEVQDKEPTKDAAQRLSYHLRNFLHVDSKHLSALNLDSVANQPAFSFQVELRGQLDRWKERMPPAFPLAEVGIQDEAQAMRLRGYVADKVIQDDFAEYEKRVSGYPLPPDVVRGFCSTLRGDLGELSGRAMENALHFLAVCLSRAVAGVDYRQQTVNGHVSVQQSRAPHPEVSSQTLSLLSQATQHFTTSRFDFRLSPHFEKVVQPFLIFLQEVAQIPAAKRVPQPGDRELRAMDLNPATPL